MSLSYSAGSLTMNFDVSVMTNATWSTSLISGSGETPLFSRQIHATHPPRASTIKHRISAQGNVGVLSSLSTAGGSFLCTDFQIIDTGGPGLTVDELRRLAGR